MTAFHVRYWFDSNSANRTGEQVIELMEADSQEEVLRKVQDRLRREPDFTITPAFGLAAQRRGGGAAGIVLLRSDHIRYVEVFPAPTTLA
jgi:hypothetical protein